MNLHEMTGLGRPLDISHPSNRTAIWLTAISGVSSATLSWLLSGNLDLMRSGSLALGVFLAWAIARELDPDRPRSATVAMIVTWAIALFAPPALVAVVVTLFAVRVLAGTVGSGLRGLDYLVVIGASAIAAAQPVAWPAIGVLGYAVWREKSAPNWQLLAMGVAAVIVAAGSGVIPQAGLPGIGSAVLLIGVTLVWLTRRQPTMLSSMCDTGDRPVDAIAVSRARFAALVAVIGGSVLSPTDALALGPVVASMLALAVPDDRPAPSGRNRETRPVDVSGPEFTEPHPLGAGTIPPVL